MKQTALIVALAAIALTAQAADISIPQDSITIPDAAVADVQAWLATEQLTRRETVIVTTTNDVGDVDRRVRSVLVVTPETPQAKLQRIAHSAAVEAIRSGLRQFRQERADKAAQAAADALPDPVAE